MNFFFFWIVVIIMKRSLRKYERASLNNSNTETSNNFLTTLGLRPIKKRSSSAVDKLDDKEPVNINFFVNLPNSTLFNLLLKIFSEDIKTRQF